MQISPITSVPSQPSSNALWNARTETENASCDLGLLENDLYQGAQSNSVVFEPVNMAGSVAGSLEAAGRAMVALGAPSTSAAGHKLVADADQVRPMQALFDAASARNEHYSQDPEWSAATNQYHSDVLSAIDAINAIDPSA